MKLVLLTKGAWKIVTGSETHPDKANQEEMVKFHRKSDTALAAFLPSVSNECSASVVDMEDPKQVWDTLKAQLNAVSSAAVDTYLERYQSIQMEHGEGVMQYVNRLTDLENRLAAIGNPVSREEKRRSILRGLDADFDTVSDMIQELDKDRSASIGILITKEIALNRKRVDSSNNGGSVLTVTSYKNKKCTHCGRPGLFKADCFDNPASAKYKPDKRATSRKHSVVIGMIIRNL